MRKFHFHVENKIIRQTELSSSGLSKTIEALCWFSQSTAFKNLGLEFAKASSHVIQKSDPVAQIRVRIRVRRTGTRRQP